MLCQLNRLTDRRERAWSEIDRNENVPDGAEAPFERLNKIARSLAAKRSESSELSRCAEAVIDIDGARFIHTNSGCLAPLTMPKFRRWVLVSTMSFS
jgi:hypothetical protein